MTTAIYLRISSDKTGQRLGVERQGEDCGIRAGAGALVFEDNDVTGRGTKPRPRFDALLAAIEAGQIGTIVAWSWERLERNRRDGLRLIEACQAARVLIVLVQGADMDMSTSGGRLAADMYSAIARNEVDLKDERSKRARDQRLARGEKAMPGGRGWGYTRRMVIVPAEAALVNEAIDRVLGGEALAGICRDFAARGVVGPSGKPWRPGNLGAALRKPSLTGLLEHHEVILGQGAWTPIVDRARWESLGALMAGRRVSPGGTATTLLSGIATCGAILTESGSPGADSVGRRCQGRIVAGGDTRSNRLYKCMGGAHLAVQRGPRDDFVLDRVGRHLATYEGLEVEEDRLERRSGMVDPALVREIEALETRLDQLAADLGLSERVLTLRAAAIEGQLAGLRERLAASAADTVGPSRIETVLPLGEHQNYRDAWLAADLTVQRRVLRDWYTVEIYPPGRGAKVFNDRTVVLETKAGLPGWSDRQVFRLG